MGALHLAENPRPFAPMPKVAWMQPRAPQLTTPPDQIAAADAIAELKRRGHHQNPQTRQ